VSQKFQRKIQFLILLGQHVRAIYLFGKNMGEKLRFCKVERLAGTFGSVGSSVSHTQLSIFTPHLPNQGFLLNFPFLSLFPGSLCGEGGG
jgi:hypothetical protein